MSTSTRPCEQNWQIIVFLDPGLKKNLDVCCVYLILCSRMSAPNCLKENRPLLCVRGGGSERLPSRTLRRLDNCKENLFVVGLYKVKCTPLANAMFIDKRKIKIKNKHYHTAIFFSVCLFILIDFGTYGTDFLSRSVQSCVQHN